MYLHLMVSHFKKQFSSVDNVSFLYYNKVMYDYFNTPSKADLYFLLEGVNLFFSHFDLQLIGGKTFLMACNSFAVQQVVFLFPSNNVALMISIVPELVLTKCINYFLISPKESLDSIRPDFNSRIAIKNQMSIRYTRALEKLAIQYFLLHIVTIYFFL